MDNAIQLRITTDMTALPAAIEFNYTELKAGLENYLRRFDGLVVTEDEIRQATVDRAEINRVARTIARARIDTKKRYLEPFELFEARAKELEGLCKSVEEKIAEQLAAFERDRVEKKKQRLEDLWAKKREEAFAPLNMMDSPHFAEFFADRTNPRRTGCWLNKGVSEEAAGNEMDAEIKRCQEVMETVASMYAEADEEIKAKADREAERTMDIQRVVQAVHAFRAEREAMEIARATQRLRAAADERVLRAAEDRAGSKADATDTQAVQPAPAPVPVPDSTESSDKTEKPQKAPKLHTITVRMTGTRGQFCQLQNAMESIGIIYERI